MPYFESLRTVGRLCAIALPHPPSRIRVAAYAVNRTKRLIKAPKLYGCDTALALHLTGEEVDLVIETPTRTIPIEVKAATRLGPVDARGLEGPAAVCGYRNVSTDEARARGALVAYLLSSSCAGLYGPGSAPNGLRGNQSDNEGGLQALNGDLGN
jgi:hypothetical protein